jgi:hypothetical protein
MPERRQVVTGEKIKYTGYFVAKDLWRFIDKWFADNGFGDRIEIYHDEKVTKTHKDIEVKYMPYKKVSDYIKIEHRLIIKIFDLVKKTIEKDGHKIKVDQGSVDIQFDSYITTDYEGRWENRPEFFFLRTIFDKFVFKTYTGKYEGMIAKHVDELKQEIEGFLNIYRY